MAIVNGNDFIQASARDNSSRYYYTDIITDADNNTVYNLYKFSDLSSEATLVHKVKENERGRLDIIANRYFGSPKYWWMIALANNLADATIVVPGMSLRIPSTEAFHNKNV